MDTYNFSEKERRYLAPRMEAADRINLEIKAALDLIGSQNDLEGRWDLSPDRSGLVKAKPGPEKGNG